MPIQGMSSISYGSTRTYPEKANLVGLTIRTSPWGL